MNGRNVRDTRTNAHEKTGALSIAAHWQANGQRTYLHAVHIHASQDNTDQTAGTFVDDAFQRFL